MQAVNSKGASDPSEVNLTGALAEGTPTAAPVPARGDLTSAVQIELEWTPPTASLEIGGSVITGFKIYWDSGSGDNGVSTFESLHTITDASQLSYITTTVTQGTTYAFKVSAVNAHGEGPLSDSFSVTPAAPPDAPTDLNLISADSS